MKSLNKHVLPPPLTGVKVEGAILFIRMNEASEPESFTLKEYTDYVANPVLLPVGGTDSEEEGATDDESDGSSVESEDDVPVASAHGKGTKRASRESAPEEDDDDDDDDDEDEEEEEDEDDTEFALVELTQAFVTKNRRQPTPEELMDLIKQHYGDAALVGDSDDEAIIDTDASDDSESDSEPAVVAPPVPPPNRSFKAAKQAAKAKAAAAKSTPAPAAASKPSSKKRKA